MSSIIIVLPKLEDAKHIKDILARRGLTADLQLSDQGHALYTAGGISARLF